jgi:hypothetical protein
LADVSKPVLTSLSFDVTDLRARASSYVSLRVSANDTDTPLNRLKLSLDLDHAVLESTSNTSSHGQRYTFLTSTIEGSIRSDGTGYLYPNLDAGTDGGLYQIIKATLTDAGGNSTSYSTAELAAAGFKQVSKY